MRDRRPPISTGFRSPKRPGVSGDGRAVEPPPLFPEADEHRHLHLVHDEALAHVTPIHPLMARLALHEEVEPAANARCYMEPYPDHSGAKARRHRIKIWRRHIT